MIIVAWAVFAALVAFWASSKGRSFWGFLILSVFLSPLIGAIVLMLAGENRPALEAQALSDGTMRKCPACAESIRAEATKCRYCSSAVEPVTSIE